MLTTWSSLLGGYLVNVEAFVLQRTGGEVEHLDRARVVSHRRGSLQRGQWDGEYDRMGDGGNPCDRQQHPPVDVGKFPTPNYRDGGPCRLSNGGPRYY